MPFRSLLLLSLVCTTLASCVGKKKYSETRYLVEQGERRERQLRAQLEYADRQIRFLTERNGELEQVIGVLQRDKAALESDTARLGRQIRALGDRSRSTQAELSNSLEERSRELEERNRRLTAIRESVTRRDERLQSAFSALRDSLDSIPGPPEADVEFRDGKVRTSLSGQWLFGATNLRLTSGGADALRKMAEIFNRFPDLEVTVLGHTDNSPPPRGFSDNWDLSSRRAATIVQVLVETFDVSPNQLTSAGKAEYLPKVSNDTPEGKATNRRIEFVLSPRLDLLYRNILQDGR